MRARSFGQRRVTRDGARRRRAVRALGARRRSPSSRTAVPPGVRHGRRAALGPELEVISPAFDEASLDELARCRPPGLSGPARVVLRGRWWGHSTWTRTVWPDSWAAARRASGAGRPPCVCSTSVARVLPSFPSAHPAITPRPTGDGVLPLNHVAIAAAALMAVGQRGLIVDWDVHHGNGTQDIFCETPCAHRLDPSIAPLSRDGTGRRGRGTPRAGSDPQPPVPPGATGDVVRAELGRRYATIDVFAPDWVLVSCGFDAHRDDPLSDLHLSSADFAELARIVREFTPRPGSAGPLPRRRVPACCAGFVRRGDARGATRSARRWRRADWRRRTRT